MSDEEYGAEVIECAENATKTTNISENPWPYITCFRGLQTQDLNVAIPITAINVTLFITGLLGNLAVCVVIIKHKTLHSPTNYYLLNLALSDLTLLLFGLPYDVTLYWYQYPWIFGTHACQARALISEMASYVSVLTVVAFSTERYLAICHPLYKLAISSLQRSIRIITLLWALSFLFALPFAIFSGVHYVDYPLESNRILQESAFCAMLSQPKNVPLTEISSIIFFIIPMIVILYQYIKMGIVIGQTANNDGQFGHGTIHGSRRRNPVHSRNVVKMLAYVVLGFFACWFPFHAQRLISVYFREYYYFDDLNYWMYLITGVFYYFSSTLNPIIYNVMSDRMRNAFKEVFCGRRPLVRKMTFSNHFTEDTSHAYLTKQNSSTSYRCEEKLELIKKEQIVMSTPKLTAKCVDISDAKKHFDRNTETCI